MTKTYISSLPEGLDAQFIIKKFKEANKDFLFISRDDRRLRSINAALQFFDPDLEPIIIPAWDCAPYETISPNPKIISERLSSVAMIRDKSRKNFIYLTTLNAATQYIPPKNIIAEVYLDIVLGRQIDDQL